MAERPFNKSIGSDKQNKEYLPVEVEKIQEFLNYSKKIKWKKDRGYAYY
jgi:hypothetical protein